MATRNDDLAHRQTEKELENLERRIAAMYRTASEEMRETIDAFFQTFTAQDAEKRAALEAGEITKRQYQSWLTQQLLTGERYTAMRDHLAERLTQANEVAMAYINDTTPGVYSLNRNYAAYTVERVAGNVDFTLYNAQTVRRLIKEQPRLMPYYPRQKAVDRGIDLAWGRRQIRAHITSGILQGDSIQKIAARLEKDIFKGDMNAAVRAARTAMTSAQNGGRLASYARAADMGIKVRKRWIATKDDRTRRNHRRLDGETVDWDKEFSNGLMFPGDPSGKPVETYNCRCTMRTEVPKHLEAEPRKMRVRDPKTGRNVLVNEMTYAEWEEWVKSR